MKQIPEQELLDLLNKTEEERQKWFLDHDMLFVLAEKEEQWTLYETEADLADRLWERANKTYLKESMVIIYQREVRPNIVFNIVTAGRFYEDSRNWFLYDAKSIHRIVAAIIAIQRAGQER